ncbi:MAG TPA: hypothetical protein VFI47_25095 [Acidimicrobiales bacterium]|nr:hypothetical protein [Acidimicrobiales bacterium]
MTAPAPGLSVCCLTADEPALVAASLGVLRDVADEIVVAVDSRVDPARLGPLLAVADAVVRFEYVHPPERSRPWLVGLCSRRTVLMVDGDEVAGHALVDALPRLVADPEPVQFRVPRRWCFPDETRWLAERPWWPDFQRRLVVQGPALDFDLAVHGGVRAALPARYLDQPLYHLACVTSPFAERRARARRYEAERPGLVAVGGGPMNATLYVPEHFASLRPEPTPPDDVEMLRAVLAAARRHATTGPARIPDLPVVGAAEIAAHVVPDPLAAQGYEAKLRVAEHDRRTEPGNDTYLLVEVTNTGQAPLPREDAPGLQLRVAARLLDPVGDEAVTPWALTPLPGDVPAGEARIVEALVRVPPAPGAFVVEVDLVNERSRWFETPARADLVVAPRWGRHAFS